MSLNVSHLANVQETKVLITDYVPKDIKLYEHLVKTLSKSGATVFGLYNATTIDYKSKYGILNKFYKIIPIVLDTSGGILPEPAESDGDSNCREIQFKDGYESKLVHSLPNFNHIINFGGSEFVRVYMSKKGRPFYRINEIPFSSLESKLRNGNLIEQSDNYSVIHILFESEYENTPSDRMLQISDKKRTIVIDPVSGRRKDLTPYPFPNPPPKQHDPRLFSSSTITRVAVLIRFWIIYIQRFVDERVFGDAPLSFETRNEQIKEDEIYELRIKLRTAISKSVDKLKNDFKKLNDNYRTQRIEANNLLQQFRNSSPGSSNPIEESIHNAYVKLSQNRIDSRTRAEHNRKIRQLEKDIRNLEGSLKLEEKIVVNEWYYELLRKQAKILNSIESKYYEKSRALHQAFQSIKEDEFEIL